MILSERLYASRLCSVEWALAYSVLWGGLLATGLFMWGQHGYVIPGIAQEVPKPVALARPRRAPPPESPPQEVRYIPEGDAAETIMIWHVNAKAGNPGAHIPPQLFFLGGALEGHRTQAVSGDLRNLSSLKALLARSGLRFRVTDHGKLLAVSQIVFPSDPNVFWVHLDN